MRLVGMCCSLGLAYLPFARWLLKGEPLLLLGLFCSSEFGELCLYFLTFFQTQSHPAGSGRVSDVNQGPEGQD